MIPSLPLLSCDLSVSVKENPDRKKKKVTRINKKWNISYSLQFIDSARFMTNSLSNTCK